MNLALWTLGQLLGVGLCIGFVLLLHVLVDALLLFHAAGMARIHRSIR
jgi:hypothetical protein